MKMKFGVGATILVVLMLLWVTTGEDGTKAMGGQPAITPGMSGTAATGGMIAMSQLAPNGQSQIVTVVDPVSRAIATYRIDLTTGKIAICSVRNIHWDLQMSDYNWTKPSSKEVQTMSEQR